jgi:hypothetical protein
MVAALGNLYIGEMFGCETPAGSIEVWDVDGKMVGHEIFRCSPSGAGQDTAHDGGNLLQLVEANEGVDFLKLACEFRGKTL